MKTQPFHFEVLIVLLLSVIPWPGPSVFKISCPRDRASVVRRIVQKRWMPILKKYQVELPLECPFHESRDIFRPQQRAKHQHRPSQWTCGLCGKSFYAEKHLDAHFDNRHKSNVNTECPKAEGTLVQCTEHLMPQPSKDTQDACL